MECSGLLLPMRKFGMNNDVSVYSNQNLFESFMRMMPANNFGWCLICPVNASNFKRNVVLRMNEFIYPKRRIELLIECKKLDFLEHALQIYEYTLQHIKRMYCLERDPSSWIKIAGIVFRLVKPLFGRNYCFVVLFGQPCAPPTKTTVGDDVMFAMHHQA